MRGKAQGADHRDENRTGRTEAAKSGGYAPTAGIGEGQERSEESEEGEKEQVKKKHRQGYRVIGTLVGDYNSHSFYTESFYNVRRSDCDELAIYRILSARLSIFVVLTLNCSCDSFSSCLADNCANEIFLTV